MIAGASTIRDNLSGAWAVMMGRAEGLNRLDLSLDGFWRSFLVIILVAPFIGVALYSQSLFPVVSEDGARVVAGPPTLAVAVALLADWLAFPLVFAALARPLGLGPRYVPFIIVRNWAALIIGAMSASVHLLHIIGIAPSGLISILLLAMLGVTLRFFYIIARTTLETPPRLTIPIVLLDFLLSFTIWAIFERVAYG